MEAERLEAMEPVARFQSCKAKVIQQKVGLDKCMAAFQAAEKARIQANERGQAALQLLGRAQEEYEEA
eukprot:1460146-Lingulodinium_polyedra.AAC.1